MVTKSKAMDDETRPERPVRPPARLTCLESSALVMRPVAGSQCCSWGLWQGQAASEVVLRACMSCRLLEKEGKVRVDGIKRLWQYRQRFDMGAVAGSMLYLTSFSPPTVGTLLCINLEKPDQDPQVQHCRLRLLQVQDCRSGSCAFQVS